MENKQAYDSEHLKKVLLYIANEVKRVCEKNNIRYSLDGGSLIGAVRHKGFIPWDDDFDFSMTRENYNRFIAVCKKDLKDEFILQTYETDSNYPRGFCKILLKTTQLIEPNDTKCKYQTGIFVDVFPWDNVPDNVLVRYHQMFVVFLCKKIMLLKAGADIPVGSITKRFVHYIIRFIGKILTRRFLIRTMEKNLQKYPSSTKRVACMVGVYGYKKTEMNRDVFEQYIDMPFEDSVFSIVSNYDYMLTILFGNYREIPPVEKRKTHDYVVVDFGNY